jgi:hypothetical protein
MEIIMNIQFKRNLFLTGVLIIIGFMVVSCAQGDEPERESAADSQDSTDALKGAAFTETPVPSPTYTPNPVLTPTPTPEADPRVILGNPAWGAIFEDGTQTWYQYDHSNGKAEVRDNKLVLTSYKANGFDNWSMSYPPMTDFYLELRFTTGPECSGKDRFGIFFRAPESTMGYLYQVSCDSSYWVRSWNGEEFTQLIGWTVSEHILPGPEIEHRLGIWAEGDQYKLYVNGFQVGEFVDGTYIGEGTFGAAHGAVETENFTVDVTEARVWDLP